LRSRTVCCINPLTKFAAHLPRALDRRSHRGAAVGSRSCGQPQATSNPSGPTDSAWNVNSRRPTWKKRRSFSTPSPGNRRWGACKAHLKHDSSERVGGVSGRPARTQRRSDPSCRVPAAGGGRHLGSLGKRHPSRGGAGRRASSGLAPRVAPTPSRVVRVMPETRVSGDRQGGEPPSAIAMRWQPA
jgi:hypothetical protein